MGRRRIFRRPRGGERPKKYYFFRKLYWQDIINDVEDWVQLIGGIAGEEVDEK